MTLLTNYFMIESRYPTTRKYIADVARATNCLHDYDAEFFKNIYPPESKIPMEFNEQTFDVMLQFFMKNYSKLHKQKDGEQLTEESQSDHNMMYFTNTLEKFKRPFQMIIDAGVHSCGTFGTYLNMQFRQKIDYEWQQNLMKWMISKLDLKCSFLINSLESTKMKEYYDNNNIAGELRDGLAFSRNYGFLTYYCNHFDFSDAPPYAEIEPFSDGNFIHITNREIMDVENPEHMKNYIDFNYYMLKKGYRSDRKFDLS